MTSKEKIETLIERYFAGETSVAEERELRQLLASTDASSPAIDEARAVMGYFAVARNKKAAIKPPRYGSVLARAAAIAVLIGFGTWALTLTGPDPCEAFAYGSRISDDEMVIALIDNDLQAMGAASAQVNQDILADLQLFNQTPE
ncbi:MAG: hypothetical protein LIP03_11785 [Bacteroidales bacterium]|nr:hypothetical protein [Bacteroidales bacterium]